MARKNTKRNLVIIAIIASIVLYGAGLLSGLSFSKYIEENLERKAEQDMSFLIDYVKNLDKDLEGAQVQELFINSLSENNTCRFADVYFSELSGKLGYFWQVLPGRLEQFDKEQEPTKEYLELKDQYTKLSLRAWVTASKNHERCNTSIIPVLYFYSAQCDDCVRQGEALDSVKRTLAEQNKSLIVFTVDYGYDDPTLGLVKKYYSVSAVPALIVNDRLLEGRLFSEDEILAAIREVRR